MMTGMRLFWLGIWFLAIQLGTARPAFAQSAEPELKTCAEVRNLLRSEAAKRIPVKVRGVVILSFPEAWSSMVIHDGSAGIFLRPYRPKSTTEPPPTIKLGDVVDVVGFSGPGDFAPVIDDGRLTVVARNAPLPIPKDLTMPQLLEGRWDCQRVKVRGVVQSVLNTNLASTYSFAKCTLELVGLGGKTAVSFLEQPTLPPHELIDSEVSVTATKLSFFTKRGELSGAWLLVNLASDLTLLRASPEPFATPLVPFESIRNFTSEPEDYHRRRIRGVVTMHQPGKFLYVQQGHRGVRVRTDTPLDLVPGDDVEVVGFVDTVSVVAGLQGALARKLGTAPLPPAADHSVARILGVLDETGAIDYDDVDGTRIRLQGILESFTDRKSEGVELIFSVENHKIPVFLPSMQEAEALERWSLGSKLEVEGVCVVRFAPEWPTLVPAVPRDFRLLLASAEAVKLIQHGPWWTKKRLGQALMLTGAILALALTWIWLLRRRVALQRRQRHEIALAYAATQRERNRLAADLHDTLLQSLTGAALQLELARELQSDQPERSREHLQLADQMIEHCKEDMRRSVWNLHTQALAGCTLPEAMQTLLHRLLPEQSKVHGKLVTSGDTAHLPESVSGHLLLFAQEGLQNILRHSGATRVELRLEATAKLVTLTISDDGHGFDPATAAGPETGHFGLRGMTERLRHLEGSLEIQSNDGNGTRLIAQVPLH
jgi:signal transduction histidine kinase